MIETAGLRAAMIQNQQSARKPSRRICRVALFLDRRFVRRSSLFAISAAVDPTNDNPDPECAPENACERKRHACDLANHGGYDESPECHLHRQHVDGIGDGRWSAFVHFSWFPNFLPSLIPPQNRMPSNCGRWDSCRRSKMKFRRKRFEFSMRHQHSAHGCKDKIKESRKKGNQEVYRDGSHRNRSGWTNQIPRGLLVVRIAAIGDGPNNPSPPGVGAIDQNCT